MPELDLTLGEKLLILRRRKGWSRAQLASKMKITARRLRSWEESARNPNKTALEKAEKFLNRQMRKKPEGIEPPVETA